MFVRNVMKIGAAAIAVAMTMTAGAASAVTTIGFGTNAGSGASYSEGGFTFEPFRIVNGNCFDGSCLALNDNETTTMSLGGDVFSLSSLGFSLLGGGTPNTLTVTGSNAMSVSFAVGDYGHNNGYHFIDFLADAGFTGLFDDVTSITFATDGGGNIRLDDIGAAVSTVPLPAALPLLLAAIGGLAFVGRRRAARAA